MSLKDDLNTLLNYKSEDKMTNPSETTKAPERVACCTCGYEWQAGDYGGHSCAVKLSETNESLRQQLEAMQIKITVLERDAEFHRHAIPVAGNEAQTIAILQQQLEASQRKVKLLLNTVNELDSFFYEEIRWADNTEMKRLMDCRDKCEAALSQQSSDQPSGQVSQGQQKSGLNSWREALRSLDGPSSHSGSEGGDAYHVIHAECKKCGRTWLKVD